MKSTIIALFFGCCTIVYAGDKSANDIAKRVITDQFSIFPPIMRASIVTPEKPRQQSPQEIALEKSKEVLRMYMISDKAPEKVRIAYAITVLADKRTPRAFNLEEQTPDESMYKQNLEDSKALTRRLIEIEAEQVAAPNP
jgi:hypothetical protein